jgi:hypothetical protein
VQNIENTVTASSGKLAKLELVGPTNANSGESQLREPQRSF